MTWLQSYTLCNGSHPFSPSAPPFGVASRIPNNWAHSDGSHAEVGRVSVPVFLYRAFTVPWVTWAEKIVHWLYKTGSFEGYIMFCLIVMSSRGTWHQCWYPNCSQMLWAIHSASCSNYIIFLFWVNSFFKNSVGRKVLKESHVCQCKAYSPSSEHQIYVVGFLIRLSHNNLLNCHLCCLELIQSVCLIWYTAYTSAWVISQTSRQRKAPGCVYCWVLQESASLCSWVRWFFWLWLCLERKGRELLGDRRREGATQMDKLGGIK